MDRPTAHTTYENRGLPALFFVAGAGLLSGLLIVLAYHFGRRWRE